jgi:hypothetical protein
MTTTKSQAFFATWLCIWVSASAPSSADSGAPSSAVTRSEGPAVQQDRAGTSATIEEPLGEGHKGQNEEDSRNSIHIEGDRVSVALRNASLTAVLEELAAHDVIDLNIDPSAGDRYISHEFSDLEPMAALRQLLDGSDYVMVLGPSDERDNKLSVKVITNQPSTPETTQDDADIDLGLDVDLQTLIDSIDPQTLPPGVFEDLLDMTQPPARFLSEDIEATREELIGELLDYVEASLGVDSPIMQQLRLKILENQANALDD